jgi:hypothetical protein
MLLMEDLKLNWQSAAVLTGVDRQAREQIAGGKPVPGDNLLFIVQPSHDLEYGLALRT